MAPAAAGERLRVAQRASELPATQAALEVGDVSFEHVRLIEAATRGLEVDTDDEALLLDEARGHDAKRFAGIAAHWRHREDAARCLDDAQAAYEARSFTIRQADHIGMGTLSGQLDAEGTATVATAVDALAAPVPGDARTAAQRRADALVELCRRALDGEAGLPGNGGERPHLNVDVPLATLEARTGVDAATSTGQGRSRARRPGAWRATPPCAASSRLGRASHSTSAGAHAPCRARSAGQWWLVITIAWRPAATRPPSGATCTT